MRRPLPEVGNRPISQVIGESAARDSEEFFREVDQVAAYNDAAARARAQEGGGDHGGG